MRRSGLAVTAAVMLSMVPAVPAVSPALAAPYPLVTPAVSTDNGSLIEVSHRKKRRHCHRDVRNHGGGWHWHKKNSCRAVFVHRHHRRHHHGGVCIRFEGITICFN
jgi:hypothetical protein